MAGSNAGRKGAIRSGGGGAKVAAPASAASAVDRFRAASAAARAHNDRAIWRAANRGIAQAKAAGTGLRTTGQQRSIDTTSRAVRFMGLGTVTRGRKAGEFKARRKTGRYAAPSTRLY